MNQWEILFKFLWEWVLGHPLAVLLIVLGFGGLVFFLRYGFKKAEGGTDEISFEIAGTLWSLYGVGRVFILTLVLASCGAFGINSLARVVNNAVEKEQELQNEVIAPELVPNFSDDAPTQVQQQPVAPPAAQQQVIIVTPTPFGGSGTAVQPQPQQGGEGAAEAPPGRQQYTVVPGDTLAKIAARYNKTVAEIAQANNITNPNRISVGQVLTIP